MDDATYARTSERVNALVAKWKPRLGLQDWAITVLVLRDGLPRKEQTEPDDSLFRDLAKCEAKWQYLEAQLRFDAPLVLDMDDEDLEDTVVHELLHVVTAELREFAADRCARCGSTSTVADGGEKHEERVVSHLTRLFRKLAKEAPAA